MMNPGRTATLTWTAAVLLALAAVSVPRAQDTRRGGASPPEPAHHTLVKAYCLTCHDARLKSGGLDLASLDDARLDEHRDVWEKVVRKLRARQMPPLGARRPDEATYTAALDSLEGSLDRLAAAAPNPGRTDTFRRLTRTEYRNAVRDLLALESDVESLLPSDSSSFGFDNVTVGNLSPTLLEQYVSAAEKVSRLAVGRPGRSAGGTTFRTKPDLTQEGHVEGLPVGTRGGALVPHTFPVDGDYEITIRLARDRNDRGAARARERARPELSTVPGQSGCAPQGARASQRWSARSWRDVPEATVATGRDGASALPGAFQLLPASSAPTRRV